MLLDRITGFSLPLVITGIIIMIIGALVPTIRTTTKKSYVESPIRKTKVIEPEE